MSIVTLVFDSSKVMPEVHKTLMAHMIAVGYELTGSVDIPESLAIPPLYRFNVPEGANIDSFKKDINTMSVHCNENLTDEHFGAFIPKTGPVAGGFLNMRKDFYSEEVVDVVNGLAQRTGRKLRVGTPLELLSLLSQLKKVLCKPKYFIALGNVWNNGVFGHHSGFFDIFVSDGGWTEDCQVFIVEDLT